MLEIVSGANSTGLVGIILYLLYREWDTIKGKLESTDKMILSILCLNLANAGIDLTELGFKYLN